MSEEITGVEFYWRPGCPFCMGLERNLNKAGIPLNKHNIWDEPSHAAYVRSVADGNETVPTITIADVSMVNPSAQQVISVLNDKAPHLVPASTDDAGQGTLSRMVNKLKNT